MGDIGSLLLSYIAGALSVLSPCVLPLLPILLVSAIEQHVFGPFALAAGLSSSFAGMGILIASLGLGLDIDASILRSIVAGLMVIFGVVLLVPALQTRLSQIAVPVTAGGNRLLERVDLTGVRGQFLLGLLLGAVWSPCAGPTLGAAIGMAVESETMLRAALVMAIFAVGVATPVLALAYGSRRAIFARRDRLSRISAVAKPIMGTALVTVGTFVLTGFDKIVEASLTNAMPVWLVNVTTRL
jgi:cytochrome c biogenesis protein CcdA